MRKTLLRRRLAAAALALCAVLMTPAAVSARTIEEVQAEQAQLEQEKLELEAKLDDLREDAAKKEAYQEALSEQIAVVKKQIDTARSDIEALNQSINTLTEKIEASQKDIEDTLNLFKERLKALYTAGEVSTLQVLLDSRSFTDFSMRTQAIQSMSEQDQRIMAVLEEYMENTKAEREEREAQKREVSQLKKTLEEKQNELGLLYEENEVALAEVRDSEQATMEAIAHNEEEGAAKIAEVEELIAQQKAAEEEARRRQEEQAAINNSGSGDYNYPTGGGGVAGFNPCWPLPGVSYISATYGGYPGHRGLDIAGPYGTPVVAAESGTVIAANNYDSWGDSWGYYVLVYHNDTYTTRYAHLSSLCVSEGQYVQQGQLVGYEGDTGNVTGPHLHFEVYENGSRVDPMWFL